MGTNYFVRAPICEYCGRYDVDIHLGKSSGGWKFLFRVNQKHYIDWESFKSFVESEDGNIYNEYGESVNAEWLISLIQNKQNGQSHASAWDRVGATTLRVIDGFDFCDEEFS